MLCFGAPRTHVAQFDYLRPARLADRNLGQQPGTAAASVHGAVTGREPATPAGSASDDAVSNVGNASTCQRAPGANGTGSPGRSRCARADHRPGWAGPGS